jgi:hypothetical protein
MQRVILFIVLALGLSACAGESVWAPDAAVEKAHYASGNPPSITLFTVINRNSGHGGHSSLLIDAPSERVLFDPAGTFHHPRLPERNDVIFGMTDPAVAFYIDYHTRISWRTVELKIPVSAEVAEQAKTLVMENGAVPKAFCADSISKILRQLPGFGFVKVTMFPVPLMDQLAGMDGVERKEYEDNDPDNNGYILARGI